ncbi:methylated-DNA-protein-cysteine S-methyltransferase [Candidatus Omnitrophus magneticus]|uniref:Methylated-DNA-protein-cysteine S-methyltransferase n=1 Tax=Candidatus Omnitrophus magneticus TaxID=1609969 RepID=A0A0F0CTK6_9BACT|nr:methylated-DNA-protein-cysteine S-methyltransferase [Candidatus Omnitrophus magneticus]
MNPKKFYIKKIDNDLTLTPFTKQVLKIVTTIPKGETRSYAWVAQKLGIKAYRAVGQALKKNPYAPNVPCHRVIASNGSIGGYFAGFAYKKELLRKEGIKCF